MADTSSVYSMRKDDPENSSTTPSQFLLDLQTKQKLSFSKFPVFEFPCIPLIGVYGDNYWPTSLHAIIEIPFSPALNLPEKLLRCVERWNSRSLEFRVVIHELPLFAECQKFSCSNVDEFNVMYHTWAFPKHLVDEEASTVEKLESGCFEPFGVQGVHLNLSDGGLAINEVKVDYTVVIHDLAFSPANLMLQVSHSHPLVSFYSVAHLPNPDLRKTVVQLHIISVTEEMERQMKGALAKSSSVGDLVQNIDTIDPTKDVSAQLRRLFDSVLLL